MCEGVPSQLSRIKAMGNDPRKRRGRRLKVPRNVAPLLVARSVGDSDIAMRDNLPRRTCGTFYEDLGFVVRQVRRKLDL